MNNNIRVRYAPSPTGYVHIGNLRTALYNFLFARHNNGKFIVRIEDTDQTRKVEGAVNNILNTLKWAGLDYDEGPEINGTFAPYIQSERLEIYKKHCDFLIENKKAYYCFCTAERLNLLREEQQKQKLPQTKYDKHCLNLSEQEIIDKFSKGIPYVVRLNVESGKTIIFNDIIRGEVEFLSDVIDDQILIKSDGFPTYHLANVIDDHLMEISHVIRGEEWLPSTPKHILLYSSFGWDLPIFAHLPLLLNSDRSKLSKRQGDVAVEDYVNKGYIKEALINFIALLGWNAADDKEIYTLDELISSFTLENVNKSGAVFDIEKLNSLNAEHLRKKSDNELLKMLRDEFKNTKFNSDELTDEYLINVIEAMKPRISFIKEIFEKSPYFFEDPKKCDEQAMKKGWKQNSAEILRKFIEKISKFENPKKEDYEKALNETASELNVGKGQVIHPLRLALSGVGGGPGIFDICWILGKEKIIDRIDIFLLQMSFKF
jgi:glutamyl-tRNA synthetase